MIFGVRSVADLVAIAKELSVDREVEQDEDGTLHTIDDSGIQIGFRVWTHTLEKSQVGTIWNSPGNRRRINQVSPVYASATPFKMGHIVFFVPDTKRAEDFYRQRLGFCLSDRYVGGAGVFLRWAQQSEHHNLFFIKSRKNDVNLHHIAFEVNDVHEMLGGGVAFSKKGCQGPLSWVDTLRAARIKILRVPLSSKLSRVAMGLIFSDATAAFMSCANASK